MPTAKAHVPTANPARLMRLLCKHWGHKFPVELDERQGAISLPMGTRRLLCTEVLTVELDGDAEQMPRFKQVVDDHLRRMAGKETLVIE
ncbi:MAG TPA: DUF2218 domain-containing protein [Burkholderiaceae bacterium]|nr:DUF2218 domain-containing protein [Burkholderiaceae bacterium]